MSLGFECTFVSQIDRQRADSRIPHVCDELADPKRAGGMTSVSFPPVRKVDRLWTGRSRSLRDSSPAGDWKIEDRFMFFIRWRTGQKVTPAKRLPP
jgi:hypothetical protein